MGKNPRVKIGIRELAAQPPGPFVLWDSEVSGLCARRQFSDIITYSVIFRTKDGRQRWLKLGHHGVWTPTQAREKARHIRFEADNGRDPASERYALRSGATIAELVDDYVADMDAHKLNGKKFSTIKSDKSRIANHIRPRLGKLRVSAITQAQIENFMNECSQGSAKRIMQLLSAIFTFAISKGLRADNPCSKIKKPPDVRRTRRLSEIEYAKLWKGINSAPNSTAASVITFLAISGFRSGEAKNLRWTECDMERGIITLSDTKTGQSIRPLSQAAIDIITKQKRVNEYIFEVDGKPIIHLNRYFTRLGLDKTISPHTLRHSFASLAGDMGIPDHTIARMLGHKQKSITSRYIHMEKSVIEASNLVAQETVRLMRS